MEMAGENELLLTVNSSYSSYCSYWVPTACPTQRPKRSPALSILTHPSCFVQTLG